MKSRWLIGTVDGNETRIQVNHITHYYTAFFAKRDVVSGSIVVLTSGITLHVTDLDVHQIDKGLEDTKDRG